MKTLRKVKIEGFKSIESAELKLGDLNVVIGANGSGKSNLIGVFRLLERVLSRNLQLYVASEPDRFLFHGRKTTPALSLDFVSEGIETVRKVCPHFNNWLGQLEALGGGAA